MVRVTESKLGFEHFPPDRGFYTWREDPQWYTFSSEPSSSAPSPHPADYDAVLEKVYRERQKVVKVDNTPRDKPFPLLRLPFDIRCMVISYCSPFKKQDVRKSQHAKGFIWYHQYNSRGEGEGDHDPWDSREHQWTGDNRDIKNLRLTCRALCLIASKHLIRQITVDMTAESLLRLQQISEHPQISKGVFVIRIILAHWPAQLAMIPTAYITELASRMNRLCSEKDTDYVGLYGYERYSYICKQFRNAAEIVQQELSEQGKLWGHCPGKYWSKLRSRLPRAFFWGLFDAHFAYKRLYTDFAAVRPEFCHRISEAMARMPCATHIILTDKPRHTYRKRAKFLRYSILRECPWYLECEMRLLFQMSIEQLNSPLAWRQGSMLSEQLRIPHEIDFLQSCPTEILFELPLALFNEGIRLTSMEIRITPPPEFLEVELPDAGWSESMNTVFSTLRHFTFIVVDANWLRMNAASTGYLNRIQILLRHYLASSPKLEEIHLDLRCLRGTENRPALWKKLPPSFGLFSEEGNHRLKWQSLKHLNLSGINMTAAELTHLIRSPDSVRLHEVHLFDGQWAEVVNVLREMYRVKEFTSDRPPWRLKIHGVSQKKKGEQKSVEWWNPRGGGLEFRC
ncbi:hypothetical protein CCUS01_03323 [Colletotrichum cuscutae]|uniref:Uncharacterized protein n=1 Tax=Colletotrichum cuscutae TaxID=1209917 RepID=A0AAI9VHP7_9PEZI|nr:hypothetical protein CCUS01_03323 [Colletotrichum cuscutae]